MTKSELLDWLQTENRKWQALLEQIGPARMELPGVNGNWSMKDIVAHLTGWQPRLIARMWAAQRGEPEPTPPWPAHLQTDDEVNAWIYQANRQRSLREVLDESNQQFQQLLQVIEELPDDVRIEPEWHVVWLNNQRFSASEFFDHFRDDHESDVRTWLAQVETMEHTQPDGFLALPATGTGPGVLVLHAWWGLNDTIKAICTRLAEAGFVVFAPDLYHGKIADTIADAETLGGMLDANHLQAKAEITDATRFLLERAGQRNQELAVVGFSLGAYYALDLSAADPEHIRQVVIFYGTGPADFGQARAAYLGHFAENDPYEPLENVDQLQAVLQQAGRPVTFYRYPGVGHWFFEPDRMEAYNAAAASQAWERTLAFLNQ